MKGLIIKDYYMLMKYFKSYIAIIMIMAFVMMFSTGTPVFILYPAVMANMLPVSLVNYDEMSHFDRYYQTMPLSKAKYVSAKYLISLIFQFLSLMIFTSAYAVSLLKSSQFNINTLTAIVSCMLILVSILPSILLPFVFKFGSEKGRMFYLLITAFFVGITVYLVNQDMLLMIDYDAKRHGIAIKTQLTENLTFNGNEADFKMIILNLAQNAIKAMPNGGELILTTSNNRKNIKISIKDTGIGITPEKIKHIFEPFYSANDNVRSSGLGLAIVSDLIEKMHGRISVKSKVGKGTEFTITIPITVK